jgi:hypothetical protein
MSHALVLASVTAVVKNLLENGLVDRGVSAHVGADVTISALPPDRMTTGDDERAQINLFLYQIAHRSLVTNSRYNPETPQDRRIGSPQTLELQYLLTAYGAQDLHIEILLGYAQEQLAQTPFLSRQTVRKILATVSSTAGGRVVLPGLAALSAELGDASVSLKICPQALPAEEVSRLWSVLQARYRPSLAYKVIVTPQEGPVSEIEAGG